MFNLILKGKLLPHLGIIFEMQINFKNKSHNLETLMTDLTTASSRSVGHAEGSVARQHASPSPELCPAYWELMNCPVSFLELLSP